MAVIHDATVVLTSAVKGASYTRKKKGGEEKHLPLSGVTENTNDSSSLEKLFRMYRNYSCTQAYTNIYIYISDPNASANKDLSRFSRPLTRQNMWQNSRCKWEVLHLQKQMVSELYTDKQRPKWPNPCGRFTALMLNSHKTVCHFIVWHHVRFLIALMRFLWHSIDVYSQYCLT